MRENRLALLVTCAATALGAGVLFRDVLFAGEVPSARDLAAYYWPAKSLLAPLFRASSGPPLWNPFLAAGQPFAANPEHEVFHPLTLLFLFLRFDVAFRLQVLVPVALAPAAMFFLARSVALSPAAAAFCALAWGFGGYLLSTTNLLPILFAVAVLPAAMGFAARLGRGGGRRDVAGLALSFGLTILAGEPSTLVMAGLLVPAAAWHGAMAGRREAGARAPARRAVLLCGLGLALGCGVGAALLVPGLGHAAKTVRAAGLDRADAADWSLPPLRLAETVVPPLVARGDGAERSLRASLYPTRRSPFLFSIHPGLLVAAFAAAGVVLAGVAARLWFGVSLLGLAMAVGPALPLWPLARELPILGGLRYPEKYALLAAMGLVLAAGLGLDALRVGESRRRTRVAAALGGTALIFIAVRLAAGIAPSSPAWKVLAPRLLRQSLVAAAGAGIVLLLGRKGPLAFLPALAAAADLVAAGAPLVPSASVAALATPPPALKPLAGGAFEGALFHHASYHPALRDEPRIAAPPVPAQWGIRTALDRDFDLTELAWSAGATSTISELLVREPALSGPVLARRGIGAILRFPPGAASAERLELLNVVGAQPVAFCAERVVRVPRAGWGAAVRALGPSAQSAVVVEESEPGAAALPAAPSRGRVGVAAWRPARLELDVESEGPAPSVLAVNQTWDRGWKALVDGARVAYVRVDLSLGALAVPAGRHRVTLVYEDPGVTAGALLSLAALLVAGALLARGRSPREPRPAERPGER